MFWKCQSVFSSVSLLRNYLADSLVIPKISVEIFGYGSALCMILRTFWTNFEYTPLNKSIRDHLQKGRKRYRRFVRVDCCKSLWRRSLELSNYRKKKNGILDAWGKITSVQFQKLVDSMPRQIFDVIKANGESSKYYIKSLLYSIVLLIGLIFMSKQYFKIKHKC